MSEPSSPELQRPWWSWVGLLVVLAIVLAVVPRGEETVALEPEVPIAVEPDVQASNPPPGPVAHVQGQVFIERPTEVPEPVVPVIELDELDEPALDEPEALDEPALDDPDAPEDPNALDDPDEAGALDESDELDPPFVSEPVELEPPPSCTVIPWQQGERVGDPAACAPSGAFEVALFPDRHGRTAFEILVPGHLRAVLEVDVPLGGVGRLPAVALGPAAQVDGQVVDGRGAPLAGIVIEAMPRPNLGEPEPWRVRSGPDGTFVLDTLPAGPVTLRAQAPGYAPSVVEAIAPQAELLITLQALVDLRGRVVGPPEALARARVRIEGSAIWPVREEAVAPDGGFVLTQVPDGIYGLEALVEAVEPGQPELASIPLENVTPELAITLALVPAFRVPVQVQAPDGTPVAGARVTLSNSSIGLLSRLAETDAEGRVAMGPVVPGPYVLRAHADGYLPSAPIALSMEGPDTPLQQLVLAEPGRIEGRVIDEDGHPVEDARVELLADHLFTGGESQARARMAQTALRSAGSLGVTTGPVPAVPLDDDAQVDLGTSVLAGAGGRFSFDMLVPGTYRLEASHGHYARSEVLEVRLGSARVRGGLELVLRTGHRLTGRVRDGNDRPVEGAMIAFDDGRRAYTDRRGVFDGGIRRGPQHLVAHADGLAPRALDVVVGEGPLDVEIVLGRARGRLHGRVVGGNGEVLADTRVTLRTLDGLSATRVAWTDAKGVYAFEDLPPGPLEIEVDHPEHGPTTQQLELVGEADEAQLDVELATGWAIDVEVLEERTGRPLTGARVEGGGMHTRTDVDGRATLSRLTEARVRVEVRVDGYGVREHWVQRLGAERRELRVELSEGGGLRGRVIDYRGDPVAGVDVVVRDPSGDHIGEARTDSLGRWAVSGVPAGDVEVTVDPPVDREEELASAALATDVLRGHVTRDVDLRLDRR